MRWHDILDTRLWLGVKGSNRRECVVHRSVVGLVIAEDEVGNIGKRRIKVK
jgi:hypothetical protein